MSTALVIVDVQNDFLPGGALGVPNGFDILGEIDTVEYTLQDANLDEKPLVVFTQDYHPADHVSFSDDPEYKDYSWPPHCVADTQGAKINQALLEIYFPDSPIFRKGTDKHKEAYSGFDGVNDSGEWLHQYLRERDIDEVVVVGLALDYCVKATALDAQAYGYNTYVALNATRPVDWVTGGQAIAELAKAGVQIV